MESSYLMSYGEVMIADKVDVSEKLTVCDGLFKGVFLLAFM